MNQHYSSILGNLFHPLKSTFFSPATQFLMMDSYLNPCTDVLCAVRSFIHRHWRALYIFTNPILILSPRSVTASVFHEYLLFWIILSFCSSHTPITTRSGHLLEQKPLQITNTHQQSRSSKQRRCARHQITSTWA